MISSEQRLLLLLTFCELIRLSIEICRPIQKFSSKGEAFHSLTGISLSLSETLGNFTYASELYCSRLGSCPESFFSGYQAAQIYRFLNFRITIHKNFSLCFGICQEVAESLIYFPGKIRMSLRTLMIFNMTTL